MNRDKDKFESLKKNKDGKVNLGNTAPTKFRGKGWIKLEKYAKAVDALLFQGIKHNILSVVQISYKGCIIIFISNKFKVINEETGKVIARGYMNPNKLYVLANNNSTKNKRDNSSSSNSK